MRLGPPDPWVRTMLDSAEFVVLITDADGIIQYASAAVASFLGFSPHELVGHSVVDLCEATALRGRGLLYSREWGGSVKSQLAILTARAESGQPDEFEWTVLRNDGTPFKTTVVVSAIRSLTEKLTGFAFAICDPAHRRRVEQALRESEERFRGVFDHSAIGMALVAPDGRWLRANAAFCRMLGYTEEELQQRTFVDVSHPDDVGISITRDCELLNGGRDSYQLEKRYLRRDGRTVWAVVNASLVRGPDKRPLHFVAQIIDVTAQRAAEESLRESEERFRDLFENASDLIQCIDAEGRFVYVNRAWREKLGYVGRDLHAMTLAEVLHPDFVRKGLAVFRRLLAGEEVGTVEVRFRTRDGRLLVTEGNISSSVRDGRPTFIRGIFRDVTERRAFDEVLDNYRNELEEANRRLADANSRLEELATTDPLTGLKNRLVFQQKLEEEHQRALRYSTPVALILLDVDRFKVFNDTFGHPAGDWVLRQVARALTENARTTDLVARFGGEEFAVLLPNTDTAGAVALAERFRQAIEAGPWSKRTVTASFGVAAFDDEMGDATALVSAADAALYRAKQRGRNRVECRSGVPLDETVLLHPRPNGR